MLVVPMTYESLCRRPEAEMLGGARGMFTLQVGGECMPLLAEEDYGKAAEAAT